MLAISALSALSVARSSRVLARKLLLELRAGAGASRSAAAPRSAAAVPRARGTGGPPWRARSAARAAPARIGGGDQAAQQRGVMVGDRLRHRRGLRRVRIERRLELEQRRPSAPSRSRRSPRCDARHVPLELLAFEERAERAARGAPQQLPRYTTMPSETARTATASPDAARAAWRGARVADALARTLRPPQPARSRACAPRCVQTAWLRPPRVRVRCPPRRRLPLGARHSVWSPHADRVLPRRRGLRRPRSRRPAHRA